LHLYAFTGENGLDLSEERLQEMSNSASTVRKPANVRESAKIKAIFELELPYIEEMNVKDVYTFCEEHKDSLILFQSAIRKLLQKSIADTPDELTQELVSQIREGVAELTLSDRTIAARKFLAKIGASITTFLAIISIKHGASPGDVAIRIVGPTLKILESWSKIVEQQGAMRKNPFYVIWALQKGKGPKNVWRERPFLKEFSLPKKTKRDYTSLSLVDAPYSWMVSAKRQKDMI
jgi:hypothetical protein